MGSIASDSFTVIFEIPKHIKRGIPNPQFQPILDIPLSPQLFFSNGGQGGELVVQEDHLRFRLKSG